MTISQGCVECGRLVRAKDELAGKRIKCPHCQKVQVADAREHDVHCVDSKLLAKTNLSTGEAGLVLVALTVLELSRLLMRLPGARDYELVVWFVSSLGIIASFVGMVISVVAIWTGNGKASGVVGFLLYIFMRVVWVFTNI